MIQNIFIYSFISCKLINKYITDIIMNPKKTYLDR